MKKKLLLICLFTPLMLIALSFMLGVTVAQNHDIAVISVTPSQTEVERGNVLNVTVVVENQGNFTEIFSLNCTYDDTLIDTQTNITLTSGESKNVTFSWDTTGLWEWMNPYEIKAAASTVAGETDTADNMLVSPSRIRVYEPPYIAVVPHSTVNPNLTIGESYTVSIYTDYNGTDIASWEFELGYNPYVLKGVEVTNGELVTNATHPGKAQFIPGTFNNTKGTLKLTAAFFFSLPPDPVPLTSGPGTLANVTFEVVGLGDTSITLGEDTKLVGYTEGGMGNPYDIISRFEPDVFHVLHGFFQNEEVTHDVAVISVSASPTSAEQGERVNITVIVENQGTSTEDVTVSVYFAYQPGLSEPIETKTVRGLAGGANQSLAFSWNTIYALAGKHTITAIANQVLGETDLDDNRRDSLEKVTITVRQEAPIPIELVIGVVVGVVVIIAVVVFVLRRGK